MGASMYKRSLPTDISSPIADPVVEEHVLETASEIPTFVEQKPTDQQMSETSLDNEGDAPSPSRIILNDSGSCTKFQQ